ncbi:Uncharacterised protein [uncultured archaeon]|nr:Uncharacterised protein [uncultured archaeon]
MAYLDIVNCVFEFVSAGVIWLSVWQLWTDKGSKGIHWTQAVFFSLESLWNLHYYNTLGQPFSFAAGIFVFFGNLAWLWLAFVWFRKLTVPFSPALGLPGFLLYFEKFLKSVRFL